MVRTKKNGERDALVPGHAVLKVPRHAHLQSSTYQGGDFTVNHFVEHMHLRGEKMARRLFDFQKQTASSSVARIGKKLTFLTNESLNTVKLNPVRKRPDTYRASRIT